MTLSKHIDADVLETKQIKLQQKTKLDDNERYIFQYLSNEKAPKYHIPNKSSDNQLVYEYMKEELALDGIPTLNLASFVRTNIDETQLKLASENITKNLADNDEYPSLIEFQQRCVTILSNLWHAPVSLSENGRKHVNTIGTATTGSSEAIMLAGLALKKKWQKRQKAKGRPTDKPNIIMASCAQVALEKFARYFDVENRIIHINEASGHLIDISKIRENIDENTIGIFVIMGSTFTGAFEPVEKISALLDDVEKETGFDVKIHVDGASGGFVAPFAFPNLKWDFAIDRVVSINTSGHKFGLTSAGLGWVIWRDSSCLPDELRFKLDYLGGVEETFTLNFSRPGFPVLSQYYNFLSFGKEGYTKIFNSCLQNSRLLSNVLEESGYFECLSVIHKKITKEEEARYYTWKGTEHEAEATENEEYVPGLPVVVFRFSKAVRQKYPDIPQSVFSFLLRKKGFIVPNYRLSPDENDIEVLRVVVRDSLSLNLLDKLINDLIESIELLMRSVEAVYDVSSAHKSEKETKTIIYDLLLSIASNGSEVTKQIKHKKLREKHGDGPDKSFRGPC